MPGRYPRGVVVVDLKIPLAAKLEVESAVADESVEQVVEKADARLDIRRACSRPARA